MKRFWLVPLAALSLLAVASGAQAAPASSLIGEIKAVTSHSIVKTELASWRWYRYLRHHLLHRGHHHHRGW